MNVIRKINRYFLDVMKNDHRFLFSREMGNIRTCKKARLQKPIKLELSGYYSFCHFSSCLKMKNQLGTVSSSHFLQNVLIETSSVCFKHFKTSYLVLCHFLMS